MKIKNILTILIISFFILLIDSSVVSKALANGMVVGPPDPYRNRWDYIVEDSQNAYINYENGIEKLILSVSFGNPEEDVYWIFPVPSNPESIDLDILSDLPKFRGEEIPLKAKSVLDRQKNIVVANQIYTFPYILYDYLFGFRRAGVYGYDSIGTLSNSKTYYGANDTVVVHSHIEKEGIISEVISASSSVAIENYLSEKGFDFNVNSLPILNEYIGEDYSFIISWISSMESVSGGSGGDGELYIPPGHRSDDYDYYPAPSSKIDPYSNNPKVLNKGVYVEFPTEKIYFPMKLTSVYKNQVVPAEIRIIGFVKPKVYKEIKNYIDTEYYIEEYPSQNDFILDFYTIKRYDKNGIERYIPNPPNAIFDVIYQYFDLDNGHKYSPMTYTKINLNPPSEYLTKDLWFDKGAPTNIYLGLYISKDHICLPLIFIIINSLIAGLIAGLLFFPELRKNIKKLLLLGLSNLFTIYGVVIATYFTATINKKENISDELVMIKERGYLLKRRLVFIAIILNTFFLIISAVAIIYIFLNLLSDLFYITVNLSSADLYDLRSLINYLLLLLLWTIPFGVHILLRLIGRVKKVDHDLFKTINEKGYSTWTFKPKDKKKLLYLITFSILYVLLSFLSLDIMKFIVGI